MLSVKNKTMLNALQNHDDGEYVYVEEESKIYQYHDGWQETKAGDVIDTGMSLYELNQNVVSQMPTLDEYVLDVKETLIKSFIKETKNKYYMLLNNEWHYYTVFVVGLLNPPKDSGPVQREITTCLFKMGEVKSIELTEDNKAVEIWVTGDDNKAHVFYLFPYDNGVIECE